MGLKDFLNQVADAFADLPHPFYRSDGDVLACLHRPGTEGGARVDRMKRREVECALPNASRRAARPFCDTTCHGAHTAAYFSGSPLAVFL